MAKLIGRKVITSPDLPDEPYLVRWTLFSCRWFRVYVHKFLRSDNAALHDHPWSFVSIVLWRGYREFLLRAKNGHKHVGALREMPLRRLPLSIAFRRAEDRHRVELDTFGWNVERSGPPAPAWTIVFAGPRRREWYFYPSDVRVPWRVLTTYGEEWVNEQIARGCGTNYFDAWDFGLRAMQGSAYA